jgi:cytochrome c556
VAANLNDAGRAMAGPVWRGFVKDFADASNAALTATNAKDGGALSTAANALSDTCSACHAKFKPQQAD